MKLVLATIVHDVADPLEAHVAFHLAAGVDVVLLAGALDDLGRSLDAWEETGHVQRVDATTHTELARIAVAQHDADWLVPSAADEFWWPRAESLKDVLAVVPPRYDVVQALVRTFVGSREPGAPFFETMTVRTSLRGREAAGDATPDQLLRPVYRAEPDMLVDADDRTSRGRRVPLRAWYPIEVLRFPVQAVPAPATDALLANDTLVVDTRLRDALRGLDASAGAPERIAFPVPDIVDDASYAIECAAVGEVDLEALDRHIRELELRIAALEAQFWPSVQRMLRRIARRPG